MTASARVPVRAIVRAMLAALTLLVPGALFAQSPAAEPARSSSAALSAGAPAATSAPDPGAAAGSTQPGPAPAVQPAGEGAALAAPSSSTSTAAPPAQRAPAAVAIAEPDAGKALALDRSAQRMGAWLEYLSEHAPSSGAAYQFVSAAIELTEGSFLFFHRDTHARIWERGFIAAGLISLAGISLANGIHALGARSTRKERLARWRALPAVDEATLARFEGELAVEAATARNARTADAASSFGFAGAGALAIGLTPASRLRGVGALGAYAWGAAAIAVGLWDGISSATGTSQAERAYERYLRGESPEHAAIQLRIAPVLAQRGAGIGLGASF